MKKEKNENRRKDWLWSSCSMFQVTYTQLKWRFFFPLIYPIVVDIKQLKMRNFLTKKKLENSIFSQTISCNWIEIKKEPTNHCSTSFYFLNKKNAIEYILFIFGEKKRQRSMNDFSFTLHEALIRSWQRQHIVKWL